MNITETMQRLDQATRLLTLELEDDECVVTAGVGVYDWRDDTWYVVWTDFVANEWVEGYGSLAEALARVAVLAMLVKTDTCATFIDTAEEFAPLAAGWMSDQFSCSACAEGSKT